MTTYFGYTTTLANADLDALWAALASKLPGTGGALTGALTGTSATFSGNVTSASLNVGASGIVTTGGITATSGNQDFNIITGLNISVDQVKLDRANADVTLSRRSGGAGATFARTTNDFTLSIFRNNIANATSVGVFEFEGLSSTGASRSYGSLQVNQISNVNGAEFSELIVQLYQNGVTLYPLHLHPTASVVARFYNPAAPAPSNWEAIEIRFDSNVGRIITNSTGAGVARALQLGAGGASWEFDAAGAGFRPTADGSATGGYLGDGTKRIYRAYIKDRLSIGNTTNEGSTLLHIRNDSSGDGVDIDTTVNLVWKTAAYIEGLELAADPAAPAANTFRLYAKDNGVGKTQIVARFATGAVQAIATEP